MGEPDNYIGNFIHCFQLLKMSLDDWEFLVLDNAFLVHHGFKKHTDFSPTKRRELDRNRRLLQQYELELVDELWVADVGLF